MAQSKGVPLKLSQKVIFKGILNALRIIFFIQTEGCTFENHFGLLLIDLMVEFDI